MMFSRLTLSLSSFYLASLIVTYIKAQGGKPCQLCCVSSPTACSLFRSAALSVQFLV